MVPPQIKTDNACEMVVDDAEGKRPEALYAVRTRVRAIMTHRIADKLDSSAISRSSSA
jgi:hypothetical protein